MGIPRKKWPQFTLADKKLPLGPVNELFRTVEGLDGAHVTEGYSSREIQAPAAPAHTVVRLVEIEDATEAARASGYQDTPGTVLYLNPTDQTWTKTDPAYMPDLLLDDNQKIAVVTGQQVVAYYHGQAGILIPVIGGLLTARFELTENLEFGGQATAKKLEWQETEYVANDDITFEVWDPHSKWNQKQTPKDQGGARGCAQYCPDSERWEIQWMQHQARWIKFMLAEALDTTDADADCDGVTYVDGYEPETAVTTVHNEPASSDYIYEGDDDDIGQAVYDPGNDKYWIRMVECP